jgi:hypothetical protein
LGYEWITAEAQRTLGDAEAPASKDLKIPDFRSVATLKIKFLSHENGGFAQSHGAPASAGDPLGRKADG